MMKMFILRKNIDKHTVLVCIVNTRARYIINYICIAYIIIIWHYRCEKNGTIHTPYTHYVIKKFEKQQQQRKPKRQKCNFILSIREKYNNNNNNDNKARQGEEKKESTVFRTI